MIAVSNALTRSGIRSVQPHGPYCLAGYSFGGLVALEIAQQLRRSGESIELLFLLDPSEPFSDSNMRRFRTPPSLANVGPQGLGARIIRHLKMLAANPRPGLLNIAARALIIVDRTCRRPAREWICYHLVQLYGRHPNPISARLLPRNRWPAFWHASQRLGRSYEAQTYDGRVLAVFAPHEERRAMWERLLAPTADIRNLDSHHLKMFVEPTLSLWLEPLRARLDEKP